MTERALPSPLVPADVDLRDFPGMWVDTDRLLRSDTWILGSSDEKAAAFTLWAESWHQVPAASLPSNDRVLAKLSQADKWKASREHALRGWVECNDGRIYHPVVAEKALEAWIKKLASAISGAVGNSKRWKVEIDTAQLREKFRQAVQCLRALNPASRVLKEKTVAILLSASQPESGGDSGAESGGDRKGPDQTRPLSNTEARTERVRALPESSPGQDPHGQDDPPAGIAGFEPTAAGAVCKAMRAAGLAQTNPGDPRLKALLDQGAKVDEFVGLAAEAVQRQIRSPWPWVLATLAARRADAAAITLPAATGDAAEDWRATKGGVNRRAAELGLKAWDEIELWPAFKARVIAEDERRSGGNRRAA